MSPAARRASTAKAKATAKAPAQRPARATAKGKAAKPKLPPEWLVLIYKVPSEPSRIRVAVWRELKRLGGLYLQQAACVIPNMGTIGNDLEQIQQRIRSLEGTSYFFRIPVTGDAQDHALVTSFQDMAAKEYAEIVEECQTKFVKEIEFERFRDNYTFEEAEEIRQDLEKIRRWFDRVIERDWFSGPGRSDCEEWLEKCETLLEEFEQDVYERTSGTGTGDV